MNAIEQDDVWIYIHTNKEVRYSDIIEKFTGKNKGKRSKSTILKYKTQLEAAGKIKKTISDKTNRPAYYVPKEWIDDVERLRIRRDIVYDLNNFDQSQLVRIYKQMILEKILKTRINAPISMFYGQLSIIDILKELNSETIEKELEEAGYSDEEIQKMWITDRGRSITKFLQDKVNNILVEYEQILKESLGATDEEAKEAAAFFVSEIYMLEKPKDFNFSLMRALELVRKQYEVVEG